MNRRPAIALRAPTIALSGEVWQYNSGMPAETSQTPPPLSLAQVLWRMFKAIILWLVANLITFLVVSFIAFTLVSALGMANPDEAFALAVICAIPAALMVSSLIAGRKLIYLAWKRYRA